MNANTSHIMKHTIASLVCGVCLILLGASETSAHGIEYRPYFVHDYYVTKGTKSFPHWLQRNREFQYLYWHNQYRLQRRLSWRRLYDIYRHEKRHRLHSRRFYGRVYRDTGRGHYYLKPKKRK